MTRSMWGNLKQSWILDSTPWIPDSRYWRSGFFVDGTWIPDSNRKWPRIVLRIPKPRILVSATQISRIPDCTGKNFPDSLTWSEMTLYSSATIQCLSRQFICDNMHVHADDNWQTSFKYIMTTVTVTVTRWRTLTANTRLNLMTNMASCKNNTAKRV